MAFPIAHGLLGASIVIAASPRSQFDRNAWKHIILGAAIAILPDLDFVVIWFFGFSKSWHRGFTHSILLAACVGVLFSLWEKSGSRVRWAIVYAAAMASHGLLDALVSVQGGVELLWPLSSHKFASGLFEYPDVIKVDYYPQLDILTISNATELIFTSALELLTMGALFLVVWILKRNSKIGLKDA